MIRESFVALLARALATLLFRRVEVHREARIPAGASVLLVANHENNLIDPMLLLGFTGLNPRFLAKHTLFTHPVVRHLVRLVRAIPVYRREDGGDSRRNDVTLEACARSLASGDTVGVFPEGGCHNEPRRRPFKSGASRLAIDAARLAPARQIVVLPVGLYYTAKSRFRSSAALIMGEPIVVRGDESASQLTRVLEGGLSRVTLNTTSWDLAERARRDAEIDAGARVAAPGPLERFHLLVRAVYRSPDRPHVMEDEAHAPPLPWDELPRSPVNRAVAVALIPPALAGLAIGLLPLGLALGLSREQGHTPDVPATRRLIALLLFLPPIVLIEAMALASMMGLFWGAIVLVSAPFALWALVRCADAWYDIWRDASTRGWAQHTGAKMIDDPDAEAYSRDVIHEPGRRRPN